MTSTIMATLTVLLALSVLLYSIERKKMSRPAVIRDASFSWTSTNTILPAGVIGVEIDTIKLKVGDGSTRWNDLPYAALQTADLGSAAFAETGDFATAAQGTLADTALQLNTVVGPVSQSAGVPTGAVIQRSNGNANGDFVKFADGTLICQIDVTPNTESYVWTFPHPFAVGTVPMITAQGITNIGGFASNTATATINGVLSLRFMLTAQGRWY